MKAKSIFKFTVVCLFVFFIALMISNFSGYYETKTVRKKELTEEQIKKFEKDISEGKDVDINDYLKSTETDYSNKLSKDVYNMSLKLESVVDSTLKYIFNGASKLVSD